MIAMPEELSDMIENFLINIEEYYKNNKVEHEVIHFDHRMINGGQISLQIIDNTKKDE